MRLLREIRGLFDNYQLKSGLFHFDRGEYKQALDYFARAIDSGKLEETDLTLARYWVVQTHIAAAEQFEEQGEPLKAIAEYERAVGTHPDYPDLHFRLARQLHAIGERERAVAAYTEAIRANPDYTDAHLGLAVALLEAGRGEEAKAAFERVYELALAAIAGPWRRGLEALDLGDHGGALEWFKDAFYRRPQLFDERYKRGLKLLARGRFDEAAEHLRGAIEINPKYADVYNYLGVALVESGRPQEAEQMFRQSIELNPDYMEAHINLGFTLARLGSRREAVQQLRFVLNKEPNNMAVLAKLRELTPAAEERERKPGEARSRAETRHDR